MSMVGHAKRWNEEKGYGFITPQDGSEDIFCHRTSILDGDCLVEGTQVYYDSELEGKRNKQRAVNVRGGKQKGEGKGRRRLSSGDSLDSGDSPYSQGDRLHAQQSYNAGMYTGPTAVPFPMIPMQAVYNAGSFGSPVAFMTSPVTSPTMNFSSPMQIQVQMQPTYAQPMFYNQSNQSGNEMPGTMAKMPSPQLIVADSYKPWGGQGFGDYED